MTSIAVDPKNDCLFVGTQGAGVWRRELGK